MGENNAICSIGFVYRTPIPTYPTYYYLTFIHLENNLNSLEREKQLDST